MTINTSQDTTKLLQDQLNKQSQIQSQLSNKIIQIPNQAEFLQEQLNKQIKLQYQLKQRQEQIKDTNNTKPLDTISLNTKFNKILDDITHLDTISSDKTIDITQIKIKFNNNSPKIKLLDETDYKSNKNHYTGDINQKYETQKNINDTYKKEIRDQIEKIKLMHQKKNIPRNLQIMMFKDIQELEELEQSFDFYQKPKRYQSI